MPYVGDNASAGGGDLEKLRLAVREITDKFGSVDGFLEALGLSEMPQAQRYGILFGCAVFACTISAVLALLVLGGSFRRVAEQAQTGESTVPTAGEARAKRALLLEILLEGRQRMEQRYPQPPTTEKPTPLTVALLNVAPGPAAPPRSGDTAAADENATPTPSSSSDKKKKKKQQQQRYIPPFYEENYIQAYRKCQDRPGGASGRRKDRWCFADRNSSIAPVFRSLLMAL